MGGNRGDWLGHGGDSEDRVSFDGQIRFDVPISHADALSFTIAPNKSCRPGELSGAYDLLQGCFDFAFSFHVSWLHLSSKL